MEFATINSSSEQDEFIAQMSAHDCEFLGVNMLKQSHSPLAFAYKTIDDALFPIPFVDGLQWQQGQPNHDWQECVSFRNGYLEDFICDWTPSCYICTEDFVSTPTAAPTVPISPPSPNPTPGPTPAKNPRPNYGN